MKPLDYIGLNIDVKSKGKNKRIKIDENLWNNVAPIIASEMTENLNSKSKKVAENIVNKNTRKKTRSSVEFDGALNASFLPITTLAKYRVLARIIQKLIARTPIDENYYYSIVRTVNGSDYTIIRKHTKDDSVARNDWKFTFVLETGKQVSITSVDLMNCGCSFEDENNKSEIKIIADYISKLCDKEDYKSFSFVNTNPHFEFIEFGLYNSDGPYASGQDKYQHKNKEFHGSYNGYSVQAPRGVIRLTATEFNNSLIAAEKKLSNKRITAGKIKVDSSFMMNEQMKESLHQIQKKGVFREKDILKALLQEKSEIPVKEDNEQQEFNKKENEIFYNFYKTIKPSIDKFETRIKAKDTERKRKTRAVHKNNTHNRTSIYGTIMCDKIKENITLIQEEADNKGLFEIGFEIEGQVETVVCKVENGKVLYNTIIQSKSSAEVLSHKYRDTREDAARDNYEEIIPGERLESWATAENFIRTYFKKYVKGYKRQRSRKYENYLLEETLKQLKRKNNEFFQMTD